MSLFISGYLLQRRVNERRKKKGKFESDNIGIVGFNFPEVVVLGGGRGASRQVRPTRSSVMSFDYHYSISSFTTKVCTVVPR